MASTPSAAPFCDPKDGKHRRDGACSFGRLGLPSLVVKPVRKALRREGFTLLELLCVVAIVGVILGLFLPVIAGARARSQAVTCVTHMAQFANASAMYAADQSDFLPPNRPGAAAKPPQTWVQGWFQGNSGDTTNQAYLKNSVLGPYLVDLQLWRCPADTTKSTINGVQIDRVRSLSLNQFLGSPWPLPKRQVFRRMAELQTATPGDLWSFTDESPQTLDDGTFAVMDDFNFGDPRSWRILDLPGTFHYRASGMAFADGHAGLKVWNDPRTVGSQVGYQSMPNNRDVLWLEVHSTVNR